MNWWILDADIILINVFPSDSHLSDREQRVCPVSSVGRASTCDPGATGLILGGGVIIPWQLISDIESNGYMSLTTDSEIVLD